MIALFPLAFAATATTAPIEPIAPIAEDEPEQQRRAPRVLIVRTISGEAAPKEPKLEEGALRAFSDAFAESAGAVFGWRRFETLAGEELDRSCRSEECARDAGLAAGATHVVFSRLTKLRDASCVAVAILRDLLRDEAVRELKVPIAPCTADNLLSGALDLGRKVAEGRRAPVAVTLSLTPLEIPSIDIPDIPDVSPYSTSTSTRTRRGFSLQRALELYRTQHMFVFTDEQHAGAFFIARDRRVINECDARRAASAPIPGDVLEFCEGNNWEWAWAAFPVGLLFAGLGGSDLNTGGGFTFVFGSGIAITSVLIAAFFNVDAVDVSSGEHYSSRDQLESIVARSNGTLREVLDLTEAEVQIAGMKP